MQWSNHTITPSPSVTPVPDVVPVRVDHKAYFSSERTFIQWMHVSLTLGAIALSLTMLADSYDVRLAGVLLIAPSLFFLCYGVFAFYRRKSALERGAVEALDAGIGPGLLTLAMVGVVGTNLVLSLRRAWTREEYDDPYAT